MLRFARRTGGRTSVIAPANGVARSCRYLGEASADKIRMPVTAAGACPDNACLGKDSDCGVNFQYGSEHPLLSGYINKTKAVTPENLEQLRAYIEAAHDMAENGTPEPAAHLFAAARAFACVKVDQARLNAEVARHLESGRTESDKYRKRIAATATNTDAPPIVIISDSLGLPRPTEKDTPQHGTEHLYANLLSGALDGRRVEAICQRFFTTSDAITVLEQESDLGRGADVVIHLGLNDTARRMFLERHRLALSLLPEQVRKRIVGFAQKHRSLILRYLPPLHYASPETFAANLDFIARTLKARGARRIVFTTIIVPPLKFWPATPEMEAYFTKYNLILMSSAMQNGIIHLDLDRHIWARLHEDPLDPDGMHLSPRGHEMFAAELARLLK